MTQRAKSDGSPASIKVAENVNEDTHDTDGVGRLLRRSNRKRGAKSSEQDEQRSHRRSPFADPTNSSTIIMKSVSNSGSGSSSLLTAGVNINHSHQHS